jgi:hypothetical protein
MRSIQKNLPSGAPPTKGSRQTKKRSKTDDDRPKSGRCRQRRLRRQQNHLWKEEIIEARKLEKKQQEIASIVDGKIISLFGFISDPTNTRRHNLCLRLRNTPTPLLAAFPKHSACHNPCTTAQPPPRLRALLLGLGLKFMPSTLSFDAVENH